jgi:two-component sensor histidine kinase
MVSIIEAEALGVACMAQVAKTLPEQRSLSALMGMNWWDSDPTMQASTGLLRWADTWARRLVLIVYALTAILILLYQPDNGIVLLTSFWVVAVALFCFVSWVMPRFPAFVPLLRHLPPWVLQATACAVPLLAVLSYAWFYDLRLPVFVQFSLWPIFIPGVERLMHHRRESQLDGDPVSRLTWYVLIYAFSAATTITYTVSYNLLDALGKLLASGFPAAPRHAMQLSIYLVPAVWTFASLCFIYYLMRRSELDRKKAVLIYEVGVLFKSMETPLSWPGEVANIIRDAFGFERVIILVPTGTYCDHRDSPMERRSLIPRTVEESEYKVVGIAGKNMQAYSNFKFPMKKGISHTARTTRKSLLVNYMRSGPRDPGVGELSVQEPGGSDTMCELNVPVWDRDNSEFVLAHIIVQSSQVNALSKGDMRCLEKISKDLASHSRPGQHEVYYEVIQGEIEKITTLTDYQERVQHSIAACSTVLRTDSVAFVPLALGTSVPLWNHLVVREEGFKDSTFFGKHDARFVSGDIMSAIHDWTPLFLHDAQASPFWGRWAVDEGIRSLVLFPIGLGKQRAGLLFAGFADQNFTLFTWRKFAITSLFQSLAPLITAAYHHENYVQNFTLPVLHLHRYLREEQLSRSVIRDKLSEIRDARLLPSLHGSEEYVELEDFLARIERLQDRVLAASDLRYPDFTRATLRNELSSFKDKLKQQRRYSDVKIHLRISEDVDAESPELNTIIFQFISEAITNALSHGGASTIWVRVKRLRYSIRVQVADNGRGFDPVAKYQALRQQPGAGSIRYYEEQIQKLCGGTRIDWGWTEPGLGTYVRVQIPVLPNQSCGSKRRLLDWMDYMELIPESWPTVRVTPDQELIKSGFMVAVD